jgi:hypothetical protein
LAERELRKLLAPLLKAMEDDDPEVRRRARRSVLSLVPGEVEKEKEPQTTEAALLARLQQGPRLRGTQLWAWHLQQAAADQAKLVQKAIQILAGFGIDGAHSRITLKGGVKGFGVRRVEAGSPAARLGLRKGDLILRMNGQVATRARDFPAVLGDKSDWNRITVSVWRDGHYIRLPNNKK